MPDSVLKFPPKTHFDYDQAFSYNLGWVNEQEQQKIKNTVVAIPGMGGVGGHTLHALLRIGFEKFKIADFDDFDVHNFNRQFGSTMRTVGMAKTAVVKEIALSVNPGAQIEVFEEGITDSNFESFLQGVDIVVDCLDLFELDIRIKLYEHAHDIGIPVISAAPLGMGTSVLCFNPQGMSFNSYFDLTYSLDPYEKRARFFAGLAPKALHQKYMFYKEYINVSEKKMPSLHVGCLSAASALSSVCMKIALKRGDIIYAPRGFQVDFYRNKYAKFWRPFGNRNPLQRLVIAITKKMIKRIDAA